jgi:alkaline phosphatase D
MMTRRGLLLSSAALAQTAPTPEIGIKIGEVARDSAVAWLRSERRLRIALNGGKPSEWRATRANNDDTLNWPLSRLRPSTDYALRIEAEGGGAIDARFRTAPAWDDPGPQTFAMLSCQMFQHRDDPARGFKIYDSIRQLAPSALFSCGDNVYYDNEPPVASTVDLARFHWQRMYGLPSIVECLRSVPGYWQKDDHDVYDDDSWPGKSTPKMGGLTFEQGQKLFFEQTPTPNPLERSVRWGANLEVWLLEGRDYRSPNTQPDSAAKTILGAQQKRWLLHSLKASQARFKLVISPTPWVGPDRANKKDNYSNGSFATEGREMRLALAKLLGERGALLCGDRHWQYHSVDPESGLHEFGCGPASDEHAGGTPGENPSLHRFHRVKGGFLKIGASAKELRLTHCDVRGSAVYDFPFKLA